MKILDHPYIVKFIDSIQTKNDLYIVAELVRDGDLYEYVSKNKFLEGILKLLMNRIRGLFNYATTFSSSYIHPLFRYNSQRP
jgi:serine/threonine protein kinase